MGMSLLLLLLLLLVQIVLCTVVLVLCDITNNITFDCFFIFFIPPKMHCWQFLVQVLLLYSFVLIFVLCVLWWWLLLYFPFSFSSAVTV